MHTSLPHYLDLLPSHRAMPTFSARHHLPDLPRLQLTMLGPSNPAAASADNAWAVEPLSVFIVCTCVYVQQQQQIDRVET